MLKEIVHHDSGVRTTALLLLALLDFALGTDEQEVDIA